MLPGWVVRVVRVVPRGCCRRLVVVVRVAMVVVVVLRVVWVVPVVWVGL